MRKMKYTFIFCLFTTIEVTFAQSSPLCKSHDFCVNAKMPLLYQGSYTLPPIIAKLSGNSAITRDTGWCAAVASTMAIAGERLISPAGIVYPNDIESIASLKISTDLHKRTSQYAPAIFSVGQKIGTKWAGGGTLFSGTIAGFRAYTSNIKKNFFTQTVGSVTSYAKGLTYENFHQMFKQDMPGFVFRVCARDTSTYSSNTIFGCHLITLNGYENGSLKIYDPWGRIYNVNVQKALTVQNLWIRLSQVPVLSFSQGVAGYVNTSSGRTVTVQEYVYLYSRNK